MEEKTQERQVAVKLTIADIKEGKYVKEEGWNPNYILTKDNRKASRVNVLGTVVSAPTVDINYRSAVLDDGSGSINVRSFDESDVFKSIGPGDAVFVIGRPRQYGPETYLMPEIIKKVHDRGWIKVRKAETTQSRGPEAARTPEIVGGPKATAEFEDGAAEGKAAGGEENRNVVEKEGAAMQSREESAPSSQQKIYSIIKEHDKGEGIGFEEVVEKSGVPEAERIINQLLMEGEIFELGKGRLKVLE